MKSNSMAVKSCLATLLITGALMVGCRPAEAQPGTALGTVQREITSEPELAANRIPPGDQVGKVEFGLSFHREDGNRFVQGRGAMPQTQVVDVPIGMVPIWLVGVPWAEGSLWAVVLNDGSVESFFLEGNEVRSILLNTEHFAVGQPPFLMSEFGEAFFLRSPSLDDSTLSHPVSLLDGGAYAYLSKAGALVVQRVDESFNLELNALPDGRILRSQEGHLVLFTDASDRYPHGVLGDTLESLRIAIIDVKGIPRVIHFIYAPEDSVFEGLAPILADLDGDGEPEIIVTASNQRSGARLLAYSMRGDLRARSEPIGQGFRWRHPIAVGSFSSGGGLELASVRTPHLQGTVEFHTMQGEALVLTAAIEGFTSHVIGSRNLDMALAGDFDGEGSIELLLQDQGRSSLGAIRRIGDQAVLAWSVTLAAPLTTNLAAVTLFDGSIVVGVGVEDGSLRFWLP